MKIIRFILAILKVIAFVFMLVSVWLIGICMLIFCFIADEVNPPKTYI